MSYASITQLAEHLQIADALDDDVLELALQAAERQVEEWCRRDFTPVDPDEDPAETRLYRTYGTYIWIDDVVAVDTVEVDSGGGFVTVDTFDLEPFNNLQHGKPYQQITFDRDLAGKFKVTGWFGWPSTPDAVVQAVVLQAARLAQRRNAQFGVATVPGLDGSGMRLLAKLDADVELLLAPYRKNPVLV